MIRIVSTLFVLILCGTSNAQLVAIGNSSFESGSPLISDPSIFGTVPGPGSNVPDGLKGGWGHGDGTLFVGEDNGITPNDGSQMLKFVTTGYPGPDFPNSLGSGKGGITSDIIQLIDLSAFASTIQHGNAQLSASVNVNRVEGDANTDSKFTISLWTFFGPLNDLTHIDNTPDSKYLTYGELFTDSNPTTWEELTLNISLPSETTFVRLGISAWENVLIQHNGSSDPEFDGHYADLVSSSIFSVPETTSFAMFGIAMLGMARRRRKRLA